MKAARVLVILVALTLVPTLSLCFASSPNASPFIGVWRLSEISGSTTSPQPGIYIFTPHYFSHDAVSSNGPRPLLPQDRPLTDTDIANVARGFLGSAGTYNVTGDRMILRVIVALNPNYMRPEYSRVYAFRFVGRDTLWLTQTEGGGKAIAAPPMLKLTRVE